MRNENDKEKFKNDFIKRLIKFSLEIIKLCRELKKQDSLLWSICDQIIRSACSIGANIVEARSSSSKKDYLNFFQIALKSANETKFWLILIKESTEILQTKQKIDNLLREAIEIANIIASSILTLKGKK